MIVLDASAAIDLLLDTPPHATAFAARIGAAPGGAAAPHLLDVEVGHVLRRLVRQKAVTASRARAALDDLLDLPLVRYGHGPLVHRALDFRDSLTFYDAVYVALAEALAAPLLTRDAALARSAGHRARIELFA